MFRNYVKVAFRNLFNQKGMTSINILSLSIGLAFFILFLLYAVHEFSFDRFHKNSDDIYRVYRWSEARNGREANGDAHHPMPLGTALKEDFPDVIESVRIKAAWGGRFTRVGDKVTLQHVSFADPSILKVFTFPLKYGNLSTALSQPTDIVLTESISNEIYGESNSIGKTLEIDIDGSFVPFQIVGIAYDLPENSTIEFDILGNYQYYQYSTSHGKRSDNNWSRSSFTTYVQLRPGSGLPNDQDRLNSFRRKYYPTEEEELRSLGYWKEEGPPIMYRLQPMEAIHLNPSIRGSGKSPVSAKSIWILLAMAAGILLIASINFTTLAIGRSARRAKEVGVRKAIGSSRKHLILQFLSESMVLSIISGIVGVCLAQLLLPKFNQLFGKELSISLGIYPELGQLILVTIVSIGLLSGIYPALVLSGFKPVEVLKSKIKVSGSNILTKSLVTVQFVLSIGLIISTFLMLNQVRMMQGKYPGFNKENIIVIDAEGTDTKEIYPRFRQILSNHKDIEGIAAAEFGLGANMGYSSAGWDYFDQNKQVYEYYIDLDYLDVLDMKLIAGSSLT